ncbi:MAG TPA: hypothetical protein VGC29_09335, partial [Flavisolibacter sp.]
IIQSREIALSLGYNYISTLHFFLADCKINGPGSIKFFAFDKDEDFQTFYNHHKTGEPIQLEEDLPLTVEAEKTLRKAFILWNGNNYYDQEVRPYHLFLAASLISRTTFCKIFPQERQLYERLANYYIDNGQINKNKIHKSFLIKIQKWISGHLHK